MSEKVRNNLMRLLAVPFTIILLQEYQIVLDLMREIILATDLAHHLRAVKDQEKMAESE